MTYEDAAPAQKVDINYFLFWNDMQPVSTCFIRYCARLLHHPPRPWFPYLCRHLITLKVGIIAMDSAIIGLMQSLVHILRIYILFAGHKLINMQTGDNCSSFRQQFSVLVNNFIHWNMYVGSDCQHGLRPGMSSMYNTSCTRNALINITIQISIIA